MIQTTQIDKSKAFIIGTDSDETMRKKIAYRNKTIPQYIAIDPIMDISTTRQGTTRQGTTRQGTTWYHQSY